MSNETETFLIHIVAASDKAVRVAFNGKSVWLPKSQIERWKDEDKREGTATITIPLWLYDKHWD